MFVQQAISNLEMAHDAIIESRVVQLYHANKKRNEGRILQVGDSVYLSMVNVTMPKGRARKLVPKYIGLMKVLNKIGATDTYTQHFTPGCCASMKKTMMRSFQGGMHRHSMMSGEPTRKSG